MNLTHNSKLLLVPMDIRKDKKYYFVEDKISGEFYEMPEICIDAVKMIGDGLRLVDIQRELTIKYPNNDVDLMDFAEQLLNMQLIVEIDGVRLEQQQKPVGRQGFLWIPQR